MPLVDLCTPTKREDDRHFLSFRIIQNGIETTFQPQTFTNQNPSSCFITKRCPFTQLQNDVRIEISITNVSL
jgi:hypothetical protein